MKKVVYDKHYQNENYFGKPYSGLVDFFSNYEPKCRVLDLGCGQGRDSLVLARMGYQVTGVDISSVGISQMNRTAALENLAVRGIIGDVYTYRIDESYDMVLLDSMFHFYTKDRKKEKELLLRILSELKTDGVLCNFMQKGQEREKYYEKILAESGHQLVTIVEGYTEYLEFADAFHMHIVKKI
ncbi:methyltransferase domain-containing protein [Clostridia bacterium]|nr:methyltransferase domain-containing protein [Clostridia bacterium]